MAEDAAAAADAAEAARAVAECRAAAAAAECRAAAAAAHAEAAEGSISAVRTFRAAGAAAAPAWHSDPTRFPEPEGPEVRAASDGQAALVVPVASAVPAELDVLVVRAAPVVPAALDVLVVRAASVDPAEPVEQDAPEAQVARTAPAAEAATT